MGEKVYKPIVKEGKKQNEMTDEHIDAVLELYERRETVEKESFLASFEDLEKNDFNLNIPRYVDNFEEEEQIDLGDLLSEMRQTDAELGTVQSDFVSLLHDLICDDEKVEVSLHEHTQMIEG